MHTGDTPRPAVHVTVRRCGCLLLSLRKTRQPRQPRRLPPPSTHPTTPPLHPTIRRQVGSRNQVSTLLTQACRPQLATESHGFFCSPQLFFISFYF